MFAAILLLTTAPQDTFDLRWKPAKNDVLEYTVSVRMDVQGKGLKYQTRLKLDVKDVAANGDYVVETSTSQSAMEIGGKALLVEDGPARLEQFAATGERIGDNPDDDPIGRVLSAVSDFVGPPKPIAVGGEWTRREPATEQGKIGSTATYRLVGATQEDLNVTYEYREDTGNPRVTADGSLSISRKDFSIKSYRATIQNVRVDPQTPPATITVVMTRV